MPRSKKPRKAFRPVHRTPGATPLTFALPEATRTELALGPHACLAKLARGAGEDYDIETIGSAVNLAALCCDLLPPEQATPTQATITAGVHALHAVRLRLRATGRHGVSGDEHRALGAALTLADDLRTLATRRELRDRLARLARIATSPAGQHDLIELEAA